ncbi:MAG: hypothetical protein M3168_00550 [Actinomycetota bacterium]|nr:hypothetical protein [Actinomycetota bacterium]
MTQIDPRLRSALIEQLARRDARSTRVGWKIGAGERESIGGEIAVGHLTSGTLLESGSTYRGGGADLHADAEVGLELAAGQRIAGYGVALEIVDLAGTDDPESIVAANVFHRAVALGRMRAALPPNLRAALIVNGEERAAAPVGNELADKVAAVSRLLAAVDETLEAGDRIITGSIVQVPVRPGDDVVADMGELGSIRLSIA